jgi:Asp-tRNA(Asn)/Glu-tRNA(Gln) amidotransferase A subunit family amidase
MPRRCAGPGCADRREDERERVRAGGFGINEYFGTPKSPLKVKRKLIPGGSSSGSAVAVATGMADVATARTPPVPSACRRTCCGVFGLKTTFGLVSLKGVAPISLTNLDTVGPMAKDIPRLARGMDMLKPGFAGKYEARRRRNLRPQNQDRPTLRFRHRSEDRSKHRCAAYRSRVPRGPTQPEVCRKVG